MDSHVADNNYSSIRVASVSRFMRRVHGGSESVLNFSIKIVFYGIQLNDVIENSFFLRNYLIFNYPDVRLCSNCDDFGHSSKRCRTQRKCLECGKQEECQRYDVLKHIRCNGADCNAF